jgi:hypothetical protein
MDESVKTQVVWSQRVDAAARRINAISRAATLEFALEIGRAVIETLYQGRLNEWRSRGRKEIGLRQLATHPNLSISASTLYRSIAIYELCERVGRCGPLRHLGVSHLRAVLAAPEDKQTALIKRAEEEKWSVSRLESEVDKEQARASRGGRPRSPEYVKSIRRMNQLVAPRALDGLDEADRLSPAEARELLAMVSCLRERIALIERMLIRPARERGSATPRLASAGEGVPVVAANTLQ